MKNLVILPTLLERALTKLQIGDCWEWMGATDSTGYGQIGFVLEGKKTRYAAHRVVYEGLVGVVDSTLDLDHLCRNRKCCNPDHLEPVTRSLNLRRGQTGRNSEARRKSWITRRKVLA